MIPNEVLQGLLILLRSPPRIPPDDATTTTANEDANLIASEGKIDVGPPPPSPPQEQPAPSTTKLSTCDEIQFKLSGKHRSTVKFNELN